MYGGNRLLSLSSITETTTTTEANQNNNNSSSHNKKSKYIFVIYNTVFACHKWKCNRNVYAKRIVENCNWKLMLECKILTIIIIIIQCVYIYILHIEDIFTDLIDSLRAKCAYNTHKQTHKHTLICIYCICTQAI